jgi:hypothetical protein
MPRYLGTGTQWLVIVAVLLLATIALAATLKSRATIDMPGPAGKRFDYLTIDYDDHYLLSAHLAAGLLYVIDLRTNKVLKAIPDVPGVEGVEFVPELKKVYTSDAGDSTIGVIDLKQMKVIKKLPTEAKPDGSAYAAPFHKLYVSEDFPVQKKVHSLAVDQDTHRVYAPEQEVDGHPAARMTVYEAVTGQTATLR